MATKQATITTTTTATAAAERGRTVRLFVDDSTGRVVVAEAGEDAVALIRSVLADPRGAVDEMLREDAALTAATSYAGLSAFDTLPPWGAPAAAAASSIAAAGRAAAGRGIMAWRLFRCDHLWCRCSDVASRAPGSACPCARCAAAAADNGSEEEGRRDTELDFIEACFYRRADGSAVTRSRGGGRSGDTFYRCPARDGSRGRDFVQCRYRVTDERGVRCPLCHGLTSVEVTCAKGDGAGGEPPAGPGSSYRYAILDDLTAVKPVPVSAADAGLGVAALLSAVGVTADDPAALRQVDVAFGYKEGLRMIWASLHSKAVLNRRLPLRCRWGLLAAAATAAVDHQQFPMQSLGAGFLLGV